MRKSPLWRPKLCSRPKGTCFSVVILCEGSNQANMLAIGGLSKGLRKGGMVKPRMPASPVVHLGGTQDLSFDRWKIAQGTGFIVA